MEKFLERMIAEHKTLIENIKKLEAFVYDGNALTKVDPIEYANMSVQLAGMRVYERGLQARLINHGIEVDYDEEQYYAKIKVEPKTVTPPTPLIPPTPPASPANHISGTKNE